MNFNVDNTIPAVSNASNYLAGDQIHDVLFKSVAQGVVTSKDGRSFNTLDLKFAGVEGGEFTHRIFEPGPDADKRKDNSFGGQNPSGAEQLFATIRHYIAGLNPDFFKKLEDGSQKIQATSWDQFCQVVMKVLSKSGDKQTQLKLLKNGAGMAEVPGFPLSISREGNLYMTTSFIGDKLSFTPKELKKIEERAKAAPTNMSANNSGMSINSGSAPSEDFNLDDIDI